MCGALLSFESFLLSVPIRVCLHLHHSGAVYFLSRLYMGSTPDFGKPVPRWEVNEGDGIGVESERGIPDDAKGRGRTHATAAS